MEENKKVLYLMQNICDKLDALSVNINSINDSQINSEAFKELVELPKQIITSHNVLDNNYKTMNSYLINLAKYMRELGNRPNVINQKKEYYLFGKDTPFTSKLLLSIITFILILFSGFKYVPSYLNKHSALKTERDEYKLFYEYVFLNEYSKRKNVPVNVIEILNKIKKEDTSFIQNIKALNKKYSKQLKKQALLKQLESLDR